MKLQDAEYFGHGLVVRRPAEPWEDWRKRVRIAQNVSKFGIRCHCDGCGEQSRHYPKQGPMRDRRCKKCGGRFRKGNS